MPTIRLFNPRKSRRRANPGARELFVVGNPQHMARQRKHVRRRTRHVIRRKSNPLFLSGRHHHRRRNARHFRRRNPLNISADMKLAVSVSAGAVATRWGVNTLLPSHDSGATGYALDAVAAFVLGFAADKLVSEEVGQGVLVGGLAATVLRIVSDTVGKNNPAAASALSDFQSSYFFEPSVNSGANQAVVPPPFTQYLPPPAPAAKAGLHGYDPAFAGGIGQVIPERYTSRWS